MKEKEDLRIRKTRATLLKSLEYILKNKSFEKITITDICKQAKINRSTFYEHYIEKEDLLKDLIKESIKDLENHLVLSKETTSVKENYLKIMQLVCTYLEENNTLLASFPNLEDVYKEIERIVEKKYYEILERNDPKLKISNKEIATFYVAGGIQLIKENELDHLKEVLTELKKLVPDLN